MSWLPADASKVKTTHLWRSAPKRLLATPILGIALVIFTLATLLSQGPAPAVQKPKFQIVSLTELSPNTTSNIVNFDLSNASSYEAGEASAGGTRSLWWKYTPSSNYTVTLALNGSLGGVTMCVTTSFSACNVASTGTGTNVSMTSGTTYYFRASSNGGSFGSFILTRGTYSGSYKPGNDNFANAQVIPEATAGALPSPINIDFNNLTVESGEAGTTGAAKTAWFKYTPSSNYTVNFTNAGLNGDLALCVTTAIGNCSVGSANYNGTTAYALSSGTTYYFRVNPNNGTFGTVFLRRVGTDNDSFANATVISELSAGTSTPATPVDLTNATFEVNESSPARSRWWSYTPTTNQTINIYTTSVYDSGALLPCLTTTDVTACTSMNDHGNTQFSYALTANTNYRIRFTPRYAGEIGSFTLTRAAADNDMFGNATNVPELTAGTTSTPTAFELSNATGEPNEVGSLGGNQSRWWKYTPTASHSLDVSTSTANSGSLFQCVTTAISSCSVGSNASGGAGLFAYALTANTTYYIRVTAAYGTTKGYISFSRPASDNDTFANATAISEPAAGASTGPIAVDLSGATVESGEVTSYGTRSRWWSLTPTANYIVNVSTITADQGGIIECTTTAIGSCSQGAATANPGSTSAYSLTSGTTYYIRMSASYAGLRGSFSVTRAGSDNDNFANAAAITELSPGTSSTTIFNISGSTVEPNETTAGGSTVSKWWKYTPTADSTINFSAATPDNSGLGLCITTSMTTCTTSNFNSGTLSVLTLTANTTYYIRISRPGAAAQGSLTLSRAGADNDQFANATSIGEVANNSYGTVIPFDLGNATTETGEVGNGYLRSRWWKYVPTASYSINLATTSAGLGQINQCVTTAIGSCSVGNAGSSGSVSNSYALTSGTTYYIRVAQSNASFKGSILISRGTPASAYSPPNDAFANATAITELAAGTNTGLVSVDTSNASVEGGEVAYGSGGSQWWKYSATASYTVNLSSLGSGGPLAICVATAINNCTTGSFNTTTTGTYSFASGSTYYIRVTSNGSKVGGFVLTRSMGGNDDFATATNISELAAGANTGFITYDSTNATAEPNESYGSDYRTLWWKYTPTADYTMNASWMSSNGAAVSCITANQTSCSINNQNNNVNYGFNLTNGTTYYFRMAAFGNVTGAFMLARSPGGNDASANATVVPELAAGTNSGRINVDLSKATVEPGETNLYERRSLWWKYTPTANYTINFASNATSDYLGNCLTTAVGSCNVGTFNGAYALNVTSGTTYYLRVSPNGPNLGSFMITRSSGGADDFSTAPAISELASGAISAPVYFDTSTATLDPGQSDSTRTLWWKYTPSSTYDVNFGLTGFTATDNFCITTALANCSVATGTSPVVNAYTFTSGTTYYLRVSSNGSDAGAFYLSRTNRVSNDDFANATAVSELGAGGASSFVGVDTTNASIEAGEASTGTDQRSLWWKYTPTANYTLNINSFGFGGNFNTCVTVGIGNCSIASFNNGASAFAVTSGTAYYFRFTSNGTASGSFRITRDAIANNDDFANASSLTQWDTVAPTAGSVFDGTNPGVQTSSSNGSLTALSANVTGFSDSGTGVASYDYSIGTVTGGTTTRAWTSGGAGPTINATGLSLTAGTRYFFNVRALDYAGNVSTVVSSPGQVVTPMFAFTIAGTSTGAACGDVSTTSATSATSGSFGSITGSSAAILGSSLSVTTNAANGYVVTIKADGTPISGSGRSLSGVSGTNASPAVWPSSGTEAFGYTTSSSTLSGTANRFRTARWAAISGTGGEVMRSATTPAGTDTACIGLGASKSNVTPAGTYATNVVYTAVPSF